MFNELKLRGVVMCFASLIVVNDASAGWFGPSTYVECILDEMKGRPQYMMDTVANDCRAKFCKFVLPTNEEVVESQESYKDCLAKREDDKEKGNVNPYDKYLPCWAKAQGHYVCK